MATIPARQNALLATKKMSGRLDGGLIRCYSVWNTTMKITAPELIVFLQE